MYIFSYKKLFFLLLISVFSFSVKAQQTHFVYLQTDNGQPFYVKLNNKVISSSAQGFVILPGIVDGEHQVTVGFPKKEHPEETFSFNIDNNNEGFLIKNFEDRGTQLFNIETLALIGGASDSSKTVVSGKKDTDAFSTMLANVVKDSSILQNHQIQTAPAVAAKSDSSTVASKTEVKEPDTSAVSKTDVAIENKSGVKKTDTSAVANNIPPAAVSNTGSQVSKNDSVSKLLSEQNESGMTLLYSDKNSDKTDTVSVFIPAPNQGNTTLVEKKNADISSSPVPEKNKDSAATENKNAGIPSSTGNADYTITPTAGTSSKDSTGFVFRKDSVTTTDETKTRPVQVFTIGPAKDKSEKRSEEKSEEKKNTGEKKSSEQTGKTPKAEVLLLPKVVTTSSNSDCKAFATNEDFLRLRKKMAAENNQEDMIRTARKYFKSKCYSTEQIKDLSYLFLSEEGKYMFFDAAYAHTSDSDQYEMLESQLTDPYYLNRFKAMIRK
jgi:hypothetical protein